ncbi:MAG: hypothetical protein V3T80_05470, partial [Kiloniellales bacterium]
AIFARQTEASCAVVRDTSSGERRIWREKAPGLRWGKSSSPGSLRRSPDVPASRFAPRLPGQTDLRP